MKSKQKDIIMFALPRWDGPFSSTAFSLSKEMAKDTRVFYIDNPYTLKDLLTGWNNKQIRRRLMALLFGRHRYCKIDSSIPNLINITPLLTLSINFLPPGSLYNLLSSFNNFLVTRCIKAVIKDYRVKDYIFINSYNPFYLKNINSFNPSLTIYHCVDDITESKYIAKHGSSLERELITLFDLTITTSSRLKEYALRFSKNVFCIPNAADFQLFQQALNKDLPKPIELREVNDQRIIGYIGSVDHRIDYAILLTIAKIYPDWILLLVGPLSIEYENSGLSSLKNVITTGSKKLVELPAYIRYMDCGIIPFLCNRLTESIYPLKLNEYLALGKPVVSTGFSADLTDFHDVIKIASNKDEFVRSLLSEVQEDSPARVTKRLERAKKNSWETRIVEFWNIVEPYCK